MLTERELFQKAFALVSNPETFNNQGHYARDKDGNVVEDRFSEEAVKFCSLGALDRVIGRDDYYSCSLNRVPSNTIENALNESIYRLTGEGGGSIASYNDTHTHEEVVALWRKVGEENGWLDGVADAVTSQ